MTTPTSLLTARLRASLEECEPTAAEAALEAAEAAYELASQAEAAARIAWDAAFREWQRLEALEHDAYKLLMDAAKAVDREMGR